MKLNAQTAFLAFAGLVALDPADARLFEPRRLGVLTAYDFEGDLSAWTGKTPSGVHSGVIAPDPTGVPGNNNILKFNQKIGYGDIFSIAKIPTAADSVTFRLYAENVAGTCSGACFGFSNDYPGSHSWASCDAGTYEGTFYGHPQYEDNWLICEVEPQDDRHIMIEEFGGCPGPAGDVYFDDIVVKQGSSLPYFGCSTGQDGEICCKTLAQFYEDVIQEACDCEEAVEHDAYISCVEDLLDNVLLPEMLIKPHERDILLAMAAESDCGKIESHCTSIVSMIGDKDGFGIFAEPGDEFDSYDERAYSPTDGFTDTRREGDLSYSHEVDLTMLASTCELKSGFLELMTLGQGLGGPTMVGVNEIVVGQLTDGQNPSFWDVARFDVFTLPQGVLDEIESRGGIASVDIMPDLPFDQWVLDYSKLTLRYECAAEGASCPENYDLFCQDVTLQADGDCEGAYPSIPELYDDGENLHPSGLILLAEGGLAPGMVLGEPERGNHPYRIDTEYVGEDFFTLTCMGTVSLGDYTPPVVDCPTETLVFVADPEACMAEIDPSAYIPSCTDNCDASPDCASGFIPETIELSLGQNSLYYSAVDESQNDEWCTRDAHVVTETVDSPYPDRTHFPAPCLNLPRNRIHDGTDQARWELVPFCEGECIHNDDESMEIDLQFTFQLFGREYTSVVVHNNGYLQFDEVTFIHAFNADVDTGDMHTSNVNHVWYSSGPNGFSVIWDHVNKWGGDCNDQNTFQVLISNGNPAAEMGEYNVCSCYDTMDWADSSGWVGNGLVGAESEGELAIDVQIGVFSQLSDFYDGPYLEDDGVLFLEGRSICYNVQSLTLPPIVIGFPEFPEGSSSFHLEACGSPDELNLAFYFIPGHNGVGIYEVLVNGDIPEGMIVEQIAQGNAILVYVSWENISPVDPFELEFVARDNGSPSLSTSKTIQVEVEDKCDDGTGGSGGGDEIDPTTITPTTIEPVEPIEEVVDTAPPTTDPPAAIIEQTDPPTEDDGCKDKAGVWFDVDYLGVQKNCIWLSNRVNDIDTLCHPGHPAYDICEDTCGKCVDCDDADDTVLLPTVMVDPSQQLEFSGLTCSILADRPRDQPQVCAIPGVADLCPDTCRNCRTPAPSTETEAIIVDVPTQASPVCDDDLETEFDVLGLPKDCVWLLPRLSEPIETSNDFPSIPDDWLGSLWSEKVCGTQNNPGAAYDICQESCGACEDDCEDERVYTDASGAERTCAWLRTRGADIPDHCNAAGSTAAVDCAETCGTCD